MVNLALSALSSARNHGSGRWPSRKVRWHLLEPPTSYHGVSILSSAQTCGLNVYKSQGVSVLKIARIFNDLRNQMAQLANGSVSSIEDLLHQDLTCPFFPAPRLEVRSSGGAQCQADADQRIGCIDARFPVEQGPLEATQNLTEVRSDL